MKTRWIVWLTIPWSIVAFGQGTVNFANVNSAVGLNAPIIGLDGKTNLQGPGWTIELFAGPTLDSMASIAATGFSTQAAGYFNGGVVTIPNVAGGSNAWCFISVFPSIGFDGVYNIFYGASRPFQVVLGGGWDTPPGLPAPLLGLTSFEVALRLRSQLSITNTLSLSWVGFSGGQYQVEASPDLNPGHWVALTNAHGFDGYLFRVTIPAPQGSMFYRLVQFPSSF
jgi:hypothetical protein